MVLTVEYMNVEYQGHVNLILEKFKIDVNGDGKTTLTANDGKTIWMNGGLTRMQVTCQAL